MTLRILLTGFAPFRNDAVNPSALAVAALAASPPDGAALATAILPVAYRDAWPMLADRLARDCPDVVIATGLAAGRAALSVERVALNLDNPGYPDEQGELRAEEPILPEGPAAYFATVPVTRLAAAIYAAGVPSELSSTAGHFLCNHVLYRLCHYAASARPALRCGFIHLPCLPEQGAARGSPSLPLAAMTTGLGAALRALL